MDTISTLLNEGDPVVAVVGATDNPRKYGNRIYLDLKDKGFRVYPVNATRATVDGDPVFATLAELPETPDIVNFVVPPTRTLRVLEQAKDLGFTTVWVQPGAENQDVMEYLEEHDFDYLANACIMVQARVRSTI
ncbi:MAG: CoA-binding protein [Actinomycetia bacterium]|nr:CoA-binding protein [Actinomycetes bacterium]